MEWPIQTANGDKVRTLRNTFRTVYLAPGESVAITPKLWSADGERVADTPRFTHDLAGVGVAYITDQGQIVAVAPGETNVYGWIGQRWAATRVIVGPHNPIPSFGGKFQAAAFGLDGVQLERDARLPQAVKDAGITALTTGFYQSRADGSGTDDQSRANNAKLIDRILGHATKYDLGLVLSGDDVCRTPRELLDSIGNPVSAEILRLSLARLKASGRVVGIEMVDELGWTVTPDWLADKWIVLGVPGDAFGQLRTVMGTDRPPIAWPLAASTSEAAIRAWNAREWADYRSIFWNPVGYATGPDGQALPDYATGLSAKMATFDRLTPASTPKLVLNWINNPTYLKLHDGPSFDPVKDKVVAAGCGPKAIQLNAWMAAMGGAAGIRFYGYDTSAWKANRQTKPVGSVVQWGADPFDGTGHWQAMAAALGLIHQLEPQLFGAPTHNPDLGDGIAAAARTGPNGNLLMIANTREASEAIRIDLEPYRYPGGSITVYSLRADGHIVTPTADTPELRTTLKPGECLAIVFQAKP